MVLLFVKAG